MAARWETSSLWAEGLPTRSRSRGSPFGHHDVVVVGGGLTGLVTASVVRRAGLDAVVLERHGIGGVTTRGSTGKLTGLRLPEVGDLDLDGRR
jgi:glycine/D-amino acid oxidase-like deaminating enzyme